MKISWLIGISMLLLAAPATGDYGDMKQELDSYRPPDYLTSPAPPAADSPDGPAHRTAFETEKERIEALKAGWADRLVKPGRTEFYSRTRILPADLRTARDASATAQHLAAGVSLDALEAFTLLRSPGINAAKDRFRAALTAFSQVSNLDEILRTYSVYTESLSTGIGPMKGNGKDTVQAMFPYPGVLSLKGQVVNQAVRAAWESLEAVRRDAVTAARKTFWNLMFNQKAQQVARKTQGLLNHLESVAATRYESGKTSYQDVIKVRIQTEKLREQLITLKERRKNLALKVFELVDLPPESRLGPLAATPLPSTVPSLLPLYDLAGENRQELGRLRARVGKTERMIEMAETMILPPYTMNLSLFEDAPARQVGSSAPKPAFMTTVMAARGAGLPRSPWYGSDDAYLRQTRHKLAALRDDLKNAETVTRTLVRKAWFDLDRARREAALYTTVVELSRSAVDVSTQGYETGRIAFADVIGSYTEWLNAGLALESRKRDLGTFHAELARVVGLDLSEIKKDFRSRRQPDPSGVGGKQRHDNREQ